MLRLVGLAAVICFTTSAQADELRPGYLEFTETSAHNWSLIWKSPMKGGVTPRTIPVIPPGCKQQGVPTRELTSAAMILTYEVRCSADVAGQSIGLSGFEAAQTDVLVRVQPLSRPVQALRLTAAEPTVEIKRKPARWQVAKSYFVSGIEHILFGFDHLLFVVSLMLLLSGLWRIASAITAFTVAHSITLIGTTLGFLGLPQKPVESVIALSILFLAVEIVKKQPGRPRLSERVPWVVAFGFGLLHGFGFAGALSELGLPESDVPTALLTFNLGVEAGQLMIAAGTAAAIALIQRFAAPMLGPAFKVSAYAIGITAAFWFIERTLV
jgi:hydrogenase/urease accessory protein HupE